MTTFAVLFVFFLSLHGVLSDQPECGSGCSSPDKLHDTSKLSILEDKYTVFGPTTQADAKWLAEFVKDRSLKAALGKISCCVFVSCPLSNKAIQDIIDGTDKKLTGADKVVDVAERVHTAVEALKDGSVCRHYAACMDKILSKMGYSPSYQCGFSNGKKVGHAWVEVTIDGKTLYVDAYNSIYYMNAKAQAAHFHVLSERKMYRFMTQVEEETCACSDPCPHVEGSLDESTQPAFMDSLCADSESGSSSCLVDETNCCWNYCLSKGLRGVCSGAPTCSCSCVPPK